MVMFYTHKAVLRATAVAAAVFLSVAGSVGATELKIALGDGPQHEGTKAMVSWAKELATYSKDDLTARVFPQTLVSMKEVPGALRDGVADMGVMVHPYQPAEFPEATFIADFSLSAKTTGAAVGAATEYIYTCKECMEEMKKQGLVYMGCIAGAPYSLMTTKPVQTLADFKGLKVRSGGEAWGRWIEALGGIKVQLPSPDAYQALSQGMLQGHTQSMGALVDQSIADVAKYVTDLPVGVYFGASVNFSRMNWEKLSDSQRQIIFDRLPYLLSQYVSNQTVARDAVKARLGELGVTLEEPAADLLAANKSFLETDQATVVSKAKASYGIENAEEKAARLIALIDKWEKLTAGMESDPAALGELYKKEIFDKLTAVTISN